MEKNETYTTYLPDVESSIRDFVGVNPYDLRTPLEDTLFRTYHMLLQSNSEEVSLVCCNLCNTLLEKIRDDYLIKSSYPIPKDSLLGPRYSQFLSRIWDKGGCLTLEPYNCVVPVAARRFHGRTEGFIMYLSMKYPAPLELNKIENLEVLRKEIASEFEDPDEYKDVETWCSQEILHFEKQALKMLDNYDAYIEGCVDTRGKELMKRINDPGMEFFEGNTVVHTKLGVKMF